MITMTIKIKEETFGAGVMVSSEGKGATGFEAMIADVMKASIEFASKAIQSQGDEEEEEKTEPKPEPRVQDTWVAEVLKEIQK